MKKLVKNGALFGILALLLLFVIGSVGAAPLAQDGLPGEIEPEPEIGDPDVPTDPAGGEAEAADAPAETGPSGTAARIDFELAPGHAAKRGHYSIQVPGGAEVGSWYALDGWLDSGWISDLEIGSETVLVDVLYYPGPDTEPTKMRILNPAPGTEMGWLGRGMAHALEVAWPDQPVEGFDTAAEELDSEL